ncbi:hypothetical protein PybrP1_009664 [[Pythium] brassicae (nom. inval.)]|nr:hypothetical protein PybrP1_009664 [[Pythium] brassicae (nom. inval.)]
MAQRRDAFGKRDLGLLLPDDTPGDPVSLRHTKTNIDRDATDAFEPLKPKVDPSAKVARYRAGQVPHFAAGYEDDRGFVTAGGRVRGTERKQQQPKSSANDAPAPPRRRFEAQVVVAAKAKDTAKPRARADSESDSSSDSGDGAANALDDSSSDEDEEAFTRRRQLLRSKLAEKEQSRGAAELERKPIAPQILKKGSAAGTPAGIAGTAGGHDTESSAGSSESEWETDTDDSGAGEALLKPVFVPKKARETLKRQEEAAAEEERRRQLEAARLESRKLETRRLVAEEIRREQEEGDAGGGATDVEMPDDTDGVDPAQEYRDWELREMRRIKRDRDRKEQKRQEAEEILRRRNMTEEERQAEDRKLKKDVRTEKAKWKFMQKYHHKGVFYVDETSVKDKDDVRRRDVSGATLEDKFNKEMLPKVMQVKNFGRSGQTKYTHLADQDTSHRDSLWARNDSIREKFKNKLSGVRDIEGSLKRRKKE